MATRLLAKIGRGIEARSVPRRGWRPGVGRFAILYTLVALAWIAIAGGGAWALLVPAFVFGLIPLLDVFLGLDTADPSERHWLHDAFVRGWVPAQLVSIVAVLATVPSRAGWASVLLGAALGVLTGGGGITLAHELVHRRSRWDRALAEVLMTTVSYPWWCVEHVYGHHKWVATPRDPATARFGESIYAFLPRSVLGGLVDAFAIERAQVARHGIRLGSARDRRVRWLLGLVAVYAVAWGIAGWGGVGVMFVQSVVAVALLEVINYVEHYGLVRAEVQPSGAAEDGPVYERVKPQHSWNSNHALTGAFLFNLPRHADHHAFASRPYWELRPWPEAPELPIGYPGAVLVALVPPVWFRWMNPKVAAARAAAAGADGGRYSGEMSSSSSPGASDSA